MFKIIVVFFYRKGKNVTSVQNQSYNFDEKNLTIVKFLLSPGHICLGTICNKHMKTESMAIVNEPVPGPISDIRIRSRLILSGPDPQSCILTLLYEKYEAMIFAILH
jgi:hypothetical protein